MNVKHDDIDYTFLKVSKLTGRATHNVRNYCNRHFKGHPEHTQCTLYMIWMLKKIVRKYNYNIILRKNQVMTKRRWWKLKQLKPYTFVKGEAAPVNTIQKIIKMEDE